MVLKVFFSFFIGLSQIVAVHKFGKYIIRRTIIFFFFSFLYSTTMTNDLSHLEDYVSVLSLFVEFHSPAEVLSTFYAAWKVNSCE